jgi:hypothetical protein
MAVEAPVPLTTSNEAPSASLDVVVAPVLPETTYDTKIESIVRAATPEDVDALTNIELIAYSEIYGDNPDDDTVNTVRTKYSERVSLLGDWMRVLEDPHLGVYGMIVACPTSHDRQDFMQGALDMTDNSIIRDVYDPQGKNAYVVNLAILPHHKRQGGRFDLFADAIKVGSERGIETTFFESRLPGFDRWLKSAYSEDDLRGLDKSSIDTLAEYYWRSKEIRGGVSVPKDPLLRIYTNFGCTPLKLITDAWKTDKPSVGYGVLCEFSVPKEEGSEVHASGLANASEVHDEVRYVDVPVTDKDRLKLAEASEAADGLEGSGGFFRGILNTARRHKKAVIVGTSVLATAAYAYASKDDISHLLDKAKEEGPEYLSAYAASMGLFIGGAAMMAVGVGAKIGSIFRKENRSVENLAHQAPTNERLLRGGFWVNLAGAVGAAVVAGAAIAEAKAWPLMPAAAADLYATLALRTLIYPKIGSKK